MSADAIARLAEALAQARADVAAGLREREANALMDRFGGYHPLRDIPVDQQASALIEVRNPGLATLALATLLHERSREQ